MGATRFYLHLPSNSSLDKFPQNTLTEYQVSLPQTITLEGEWEVALTEIHFPHSWNNVQGNFLNRSFLRNREQRGVWEVIMIPPGHYSSIDDVITTINEVVTKKDRFKDAVKFSYDSLNWKVSIDLQNNVEIVLENIAYILGFQSASQVISRTSAGEREADLEHGFHDFYIYCDIAQAQYVGDVLVPLLRIVPVEEVDGQRLNKSFLRPQYIPVDRKAFETIEVNIRRDTGESVPFESGKVLLTLHFRQSKRTYF